MAALPESEPEPEPEPVPEPVAGGPSAFPTDRTAGAGGQHEFRLLVRSSGEETRSDAVRQETTIDPAAPGTSVSSGSSTTDLPRSTTTIAPGSTTTLPDRRGQESFGQWLVVLGSLPVGEHPESEMPAQARARNASADYLRSDDYRLLRPGWWVVYLGPYRAPGDTLAQCRALGLVTPSQCYGRPLTDDPADLDVVIE